MTKKVKIYQWSPRQKVHISTLELTKVQLGLTVHSMNPWMEIFTDNEYYAGEAFTDAGCSKDSFRREKQLAVELHEQKMKNAQLKGIVKKVDSETFNKVLEVLDQLKGEMLYCEKCKELRVEVKCANCSLSEEKMRELTKLGQELQGKDLL